MFLLFIYFRQFAQFCLFSSVGVAKYRLIFVFRKTLFTFSLPKHFFNCKDNKNLITPSSPILANLIYRDYYKTKRTNEVKHNMKTSKETILTKGWTVCLLAIICCLLWGSAFPSIKIGYQLFQVNSTDIAAQILFAGYRFTLAGILVIMIGSLLQQKFLKPSKISAPKILKICLLQTVLQYFFFYIGLAHTSGVKGSIITASNVFLSILFSSLIFKLEKINIQKIIGCVIGFAGVVIINLSGQNADLSFHLLGDGFVLFAAISSSLSSNFMKKYSQNEDPVLLSGYQFILGGVIMASGAYLAGGRLKTVTSSGILLLLYLAFLSAAAYSVWGILLKYNPVSRVSIYGFANPVFGVILSTIILSEGNAFGGKSLIALVCVCIGIFIVNYVPKSKTT